MEMGGYGGIKGFLIGGGERETSFICLFVIISIIKSNNFNGNNSETYFNWKSRGKL